MKICQPVRLANYRSPVRSPTHGDLMNSTRSLSNHRIRFAARQFHLCSAIFLPLVVVAWMAAVIEARADDEKEANGKVRDYRELVKGLVSSNKPIKYDHEYHLTFPPDYDGKAQVRIEKNRRVLYEHCDEALPFLIEGCTDPRYSLTWKSDSYADNSCVGEVCLEIVAAHLEVYRKHMSLGTKTEYYAYRFVPRITAIGEEVTAEKKKEIEDWWRGRKGKTLLELQIEAFDWAIKKRMQERDGRRADSR
jgi:hypothetical protein